MGAPLRLRARLTLEDLPDAIGTSRIGRLCSGELALDRVGFLGRQIIDPAADHQRLKLQLGIDLGFNRSRYRKAQPGGDNDISVPAHERDIAGAKDLGELASARSIVDQHVIPGARDITNLEHGHTSLQKRRTMIGRLERFLRDAERNHRRRV